MDIPRHDYPHTCGTCRHFTWRARKAGDRAWGWGYCLKWDDWFADQAGEAVYNRTCEEYATIYNKEE